jgi:hypothetical protein
MSQQDISILQNLINNEKQSLELLERQKSAMINNNEAKKRELVTASERALRMPNSAPLHMALFHRSIEVESIFLQEISALEQQITNLKRNIQLKERELLALQNRPQQMWSSSFK